MPEEVTKIAVEEKPEPPKIKSSKLGRLGLLITLLGFAILAGTFAYGYFQLARINLLLAHGLGLVQVQSAQARHELDQLQASVAGFQKTADETKTLSQQQEKMATEWQSLQSGNLSKWYLAEANYLVNLANDELQFTHNTSLAFALLTRADQILQSMQDPSLLELRKSIAADLNALQASAALDITTTYTRLLAMDKTFDQLPLPETPLKTDKQLQTEALKTDSWWKKGLAHTWESLQKIVIIKRNDDQTLPFVMPDQKLFLMQNLHAQMQAAMWGLLNRNQVIYDASLERIAEWVQIYFDQTSPVTKAMLSNLQTARGIAIAAPNLNFAETLKQFESVRAQQKS